MIPRNPERITALGGGTGLPAILSGLRELIVGGELSALTAVVAMTDDGGSSGRLRKTRRIPPPGDIRNCLVALAMDRDLLTGLLQYRYKGPEELGGHTVGNLILTALAEQTGSFLSAVEVSSRVLRTAGRILPATLEDVVLEAVLDDGSVIRGETRIGACNRRIREIGINPAEARATPGVVEAIERADMVVLGPGSLYTSLVPHLALREISDALQRTAALRVLVANLVCEKGESSGLDLPGHLDVLEDHAGGSIIDAVVVNSGSIAPETIKQYEAEGTYPLYWPNGGRPGVHIVRKNILAKARKLRHDPKATVDALLTAWREKRCRNGSLTAR
jgi:uncharacterized cofD-like protein